MKSTKSFTINIIGAIISLLSAFIFIPIGVKNFGTDDYGVYTFFFTLVAQISVLDFGLPRILVPLVSKNKNTINLILIVLGLFTFLLILTFLLLFYFNSINLFSLDKIPIFNLIIVSFLSFVISINKSLLEGLNKVTISVIFKNIELTFLPFFFGFFSLYYSEVEVVFKFWILTQIIIIFSQYLIFLKNNSFRVLSLGKLIDIRYSLKIGVFVMISSIISPFLTTFERYILTNEGELVMLGNYALGFMLASRLFMLSSLLQPYIYKNFSNDFFNKENVFYTIRKAILVSSLGLVVIAKVFLPFWLGTSYTDEIFIYFLISMFGIYFNTLARIPYDYLHSKNKTKITSKMHFVEVLITIPLGIILYDLFGIYFLLALVSIRYYLEGITLFYIAKFNKKVFLKIIKDSFQIPMIFILCYWNDITYISLILIFTVSLYMYIKNNFNDLLRMFTS